MIYARQQMAKQMLLQANKGQAYPAATILAHDDLSKGRVVLVKQLLQVLPLIFPRNTLDYYLHEGMDKLANFLHVKQPAISGSLGQVWRIKNCYGLAAVNEPVCHWKGWAGVQCNADNASVPALGKL